MFYKVKEKYARHETEIATFAKADDAIVFIQAKLAKDASMNNSATYTLHDVELLQEFLPLSHSLADAPAAKVTGGSSSGQGQSSAQSFAPTPFQVAPRPGGMPASSFKDKPKDDDKK